MFNEFCLTRGFDFGTYVKFFWLYGSRMYYMFLILRTTFVSTLIIKNMHRRNMHHLLTSSTIPQRSNAS